MRSWTIGLILGLCCLSCTGPRQTAKELDAALFWFLSPGQAAGWQPAAESVPRLGVKPVVVVAWVPVPAGSENSTIRPPKATRDLWIETVRAKLERRGAAAFASAPDTFDDGLTADGVQALARGRNAQLVVIFGVKLTHRRYNTANPQAIAPVDNTVEVLARAQAVGLTPEGRPVFSDAKIGFDSEANGRRSVDEIEDVSIRVALEGVATAAAWRLRSAVGKPETGNSP
ncbi:MAG: hypothetical protein ABIO65_03480 [Nitrospiria bacterium]